MVDCIFSTMVVIADASAGVHPVAVTVRACSADRHCEQGDDRA